MVARILFITDLHKRYKDSTSIKGQLAVQNLIQEDIIAFNKRNEVTHCIIGGDWYDRGFHGLGPAFGQMEMDKRISESVNGEVYLCLGNHFYLERDENPEMYIIQPNNLIKPQEEIAVPDKPIFKLVNELRFGSVQISFFHFSKVNKNYVAYRPDDVTCHIGVYHDDAVVPGWVREMEGYTGASSTGYINDIYRNVDIALHGHIHCKVGPTSMELNSGRKIPMFIPGSLGITQNKESQKHMDVQLPVIEIADDYTVSVKIATFQTHMDKLRFYETKKKKKPIQTDLSDQHFMVGQTSLQSLPVYMSSKGYSEQQLKFIDAASNGSLNLSTAVRIISEVH